MRDAGHDVRTILEGTTSKQLDLAYSMKYIKKYNINSKTKKMMSEDGLIHESAVRDLDRNVEYSKSEMELILAHLNVIRSQIDYFDRTGYEPFTF